MLIIFREREEFSFGFLLSSITVGVGNKEYPVPPVWGSDGTSRNKHRLDGISCTFKV